MTSESERRDETVSEVPETDSLETAPKAADDGVVQPAAGTDEPTEASPAEPTTEDAAETADTPDEDMPAEAEVTEEASLEEEESSASPRGELTDDWAEEDTRRRRDARPTRPSNRSKKRHRAEDEEVPRQWYILKVQVNREESIRDALTRRVKIAGLEEYFGDIVVPTEDVAEFNKSGKATDREEEAVSRVHHGPPVVER